MNTAAEIDFIIDQIKYHPELESAIGSKWNDPDIWLGSEVDANGNPIPLAGTVHRDIYEAIEALKSKIFLPAITQFKSAGGTGPLSDNEGKALKVLYGNLDPAQRLKQFLSVLEAIRRNSYDTVKQATPKLGRFAKEYPKGYRDVVDSRLKSLSSTDPDYYQKGGLGSSSSEADRVSRRTLETYPPTITFNPVTGTSIDPYMRKIEQDQDEMNKLQITKEALEAEIAAEERGLMQ